MATLNSDQMTLILAAGNSFLDGLTVDGGRTRVKMFSYTAAAGTAAADIVQLMTYPKGAVLLNGEVAFSAGGGSATLAFGYTPGTTAVPGTPVPAGLLAATSVVAAGTSTLISTQALKTLLWSTPMATQGFFTCVLAGSGVSAGFTLNGYVEYALT